MKKCIVCKKTIDNRAKYCRKHYSQLIKTKYLGENNPCWRGGISLSSCVDCGIKVRASTQHTKRCRKCYIKTLKGKNNPNWRGGNSKCEICGKKLSTRQFKKCKKCSHIGKKFTQEYKEKASTRMREHRKIHKWRGAIGEKNSNWKGGVTPINMKIRNSIEYKNWRESVFARDNWTCVLCKKRSKKGESVILHADHIQPFFSHPELRFDIRNGRTLCKDCHRKTDNFGIKAVKKKEVYLND